MHESGMNCLRQVWLYVAKYRERFKHFEEFSVRARLV
jgi:hypothetical protein